MKKIVAFLALFSFGFVLGQSSWKKIELKNNNSQIRAFRSDKVKEISIPTNADYYELSLKEFIKKMPSNKSKVIVKIPTEKGKISTFFVEEETIFSEPLSQKYGYIKSFSLKGIEDKTSFGKMSIGADGVHIMIFSKNHSTFYIDPYSKRKSTYMAYKGKNLQEKPNFNCLFDDNATTKKSRFSRQRASAYTKELRTFRLVLSCTGEYAKYHIDRRAVTPTTDDAKKAVVLSAMNTTITRVNTVYERDLSVRLKIVLKNGKNPLIFLDANTDGFTNGNANKLVDENQTKCDNIIGNNNYDIGHVFSTGSGGLATLGVVCKKSFKAQGTTGISTPVGDAFDIVYVAHEIGHQFGASHTFNSCSNNRDNEYAIEPGSGSTIMGYAGICSPNIQNMSDDYFHAVSIASMETTIQTSAICSEKTSVNNVAPIANAGNDVVVPKSTPLVLRGTATDANTPLKNLTYCWEQIDTEIASMPPLSTNIAGPAFRSLLPKKSPNRYLPALATVIAGKTASKWEVLPSVARTMNFSLLVRDNHQGGGATHSDKMKITVTNANPFLVTAPNTAVTWNVGDTKTISWDKSTTDKSPINCSNVRIKLSTDGGLSFPITLVENTPNDGNYQFSVPNYPTSKARIMVEAVGNIFYNVNSTNFTIESTNPTFLLKNNTSVQNACNDSNVSTSYTIHTDFIGGFDKQVTFSTENLPSGVTASFQPQTINNTGNVTMTLYNFNNINAQRYTFLVKANTSGIVRQVEAQVNVLSKSFTNTILLNPTDNSTNIPLLPTLKWNKNTNATAYDVQISESSDFSSLHTESSTTQNTFTLSNTLKATTKYYWRIRPKNNCGTGNFSDVKKFTTQQATYCSSTFTDENGGSEHITNVIFNTINNNSGNDTVDGYEDFSAISTTVLPSKTYPIKITLDAKGYQDHCYVFIDWNQDYIFDNNTERYDLGEHSGNIQTAHYNILVPANAKKGKTKMRIVLEYTQDERPNGKGACDTDHKSEWGETEDYTIDVGSTGGVANFLFKNFKLYPNPSKGNVNLTFMPISETVYIKVFDLKGRLINVKTYKVQTGSIFSEIMHFNEMSLGVYILQIINGKKQITKKIIMTR